MVVAHANAGNRREYVQVLVAVDVGHVVANRVSEVDWEVLRKAARGRAVGGNAFLRLRPWEGCMKDRSFGLVREAHLLYGEGLESSHAGEKWGRCLASQEAT